MIDDDNWPAWLVFGACSTQWRLAPMGGVQGLDYPALESVMRMMTVKNRPEMFHKVRLIERGALGRFRGDSLGDLYGG